MSALGGGIRGDFFFDGWRYDAYVGKSWTDGTYEIESFLTDRLANSLNVVPERRRQLQLRQRRRPSRTASRHRR